MVDFVETLGILWAVLLNFLEIRSFIIFIIFADIIKNVQTKEKRRFENAQFEV